MRRDLRWVWLLLAGFAVGPGTRADEPLKPTETASEDNPAAPAAGHSIHGESFNDGPRRKAHRMEGQGQVDFPVTTTCPEAQEFINQGVAQLHTFFYFESERSFRQAALLDPDCCMAYWGMAMSNPNNAKRAKAFLKEARKRDGSASPREKLYLDALESLYKEGAKDKDRKLAWLKGLETVVHEFPDDLDARAWQAMVSWQNIKSDKSITREKVDELIQSVEKVSPVHPGAHHYRIHLWDGNDQKRALKSASVYSSTAPGIAHAWHMPGHTYSGLKRYADAAYHQEGSARVDHAYMFSNRIMPFEIHNYAHNNQWLVTDLSHVGRAREGVAVARNLVEQPRDPQKNGKNDGGSAQRSGRQRWIEVLVRYELWDDLIDATTSGDLDWSDVPAEQKERVHSLGLAYSAKGNQEKLAEQVTALKDMIAREEEKKPQPKTAREEEKKPQPETAKEEEKKPQPKTARESSKRPPRESAQLKGLRSALAELEGYQKLAEGDVKAAFELFGKASSMRPEALARANLAANRLQEAEKASKTAVDKAPNQVPPLAAYVEVLHAAGKTEEAQKAYRKLAPLARDADSDLPVMRRLAAIVADWQSQSGWTPPPVEPSSDEAEAHRIDLTTLGALTWAPFPAEPFHLVDTEGRTHSLSDYRGKNVIVIFYLGYQCAHCMQQLQVFGKEIDALKALDTELVAIGTDTPEAARELKTNEDGIAFPMPLLPNPQLDLFKTYQAFDDFEDLPLHGTFLIDSEGNIRWQRVSADPFLDVEFLKGEAARVNRLTR